MKVNRPSAWEKKGLTKREMLKNYFLFGSFPPQIEPYRFSPVQLEGLNISLNDWSDLLYSKDKITPKETFFLSGRAKEAIFSENAP